MNKLFKMWCGPLDAFHLEGFFIQRNLYKRNKNQ